MQEHLVAWILLSQAIKSECSIYIDGLKYTCDKLELLPPPLKPSNLSERKSDEILCFGVPLSRFHPLSNFNLCHFNFKNNSYSSAEQALQHQKCVHFKALYRANLILDTCDPGEQKVIGRNVDNYNQVSQIHVRNDILKNILKVKFRQNASLITFLLETGTRHLTEASLRDTTYDIGMAITYKSILDKKAWNGSNKLGEYLMEIKNILNN